MAQATFSVRMDDSLKSQFEALCADFGMSMTTAINVFAKAVVRERKIPFEISADPFYSESNLRFLREGAAQLNAGKGVEHEIVEVRE